MNFSGLTINEIEEILLNSDFFETLNWSNFKLNFFKVSLSRTHSTASFSMLSTIWLYSIAPPIIPATAPAAAAIVSPFWEYDKLNVTVIMKMVIIFSCSTLYNYT